MPQKKILLIIALMFACIAWFIFDSDKNETSIAVHGKLEYNNNEDAQMFRDWLLMSSAPQKVALEQNTGYMFLLSNGLNGNHIEQPEKLWLNTAYNTLVQQEILTNKWLQSARFAVK